jgi:hypothetical protein
MQSDCDAYDTRTAGCFTFCPVKQATRDTFSAVYCEHIEVLNLRNVQVSKSGVGRSPVYRHVPGELPVKDRDEAGPSSRHLFLQVSLVLGLRLFPPHFLERGSDARRVAFFEKPNLNGLRVFHTTLYANTRLTLNCTLIGVNSWDFVAGPAQQSKPVESHALKPSASHGALFRQQGKGSIWIQKAVQLLKPILVSR